MMGMVVETGECVASDVRLGTPAGWHCVVHNVSLACVFLGKRRHRWEKSSKSPCWAVWSFGLMWKLERDTKLLTISEVSI